MTSAIANKRINLEYRGVKATIEAEDMKGRLKYLCGFTLQSFAETVGQNPNDDYFILDEGDVDRLLQTNSGRFVLRYKLNKILDTNDAYLASVHYPTNLEQNLEVKSKAQAISKMMPGIAQEVIAELGFEGFDADDFARHLRIFITEDPYGDNVAGWIEHYGRGENYFSNIFLPSEGVQEESEKEVRKVLKHEFVHYFISYILAQDDHRDSIASWFHEGMATEIAGRPEHPKKYNPELMFYGRNLFKLRDYGPFLYHSYYACLKAGLAIRYIKRIGGEGALKKIMQELAKGRSLLVAFESALGVPWDEFRKNCEEYVEKQIKDRMNINPAIHAGVHVPLNESKPPAPSAHVKIYTPLERLAGVSTEAFARYQYNSDVNGETRQVTHEFLGGLALNSPYLFPSSSHAVPIISKLDLWTSAISLLSAQLSFGPSLIWKTDKQRKNDFFVGGGLHLFELNKDGFEARLTVEHLRHLNEGRGEWFAAMTAGWQF